MFYLCHKEFNHCGTAFSLRAHLRRRVHLDRVEDVHPHEGGVAGHFGPHVSGTLSDGDVFVEHVRRTDGKLLALGEVRYHLGRVFDEVQRRF